MNWSKFYCEPKTCLSEIVFEIVCEVGLCAETSDSSTKKAEQVTAGCCLNKDGILNWDLLETYLPESEETIEYYKQCVEVLAPLFHHILLYYQQLTLQDFKSAFDKQLSWISQKPIIFRCFELLQSGSVTAANHTILLLTSLIERGLGDIVLLRVPQCPSLLRDLLSLSELKDILSPVIVQFLRVLIGPPISLNLRNLLWHGFPSPSEIHPHYSYTLLCVIISIGSHLHERTLMDRIPFRKQFFSVDLPCIFPDLPSSHIELIRQVFCESSLFLSSMKPLWLLALRLFSENRFGECVVILLPQLEHALRRIYVTVNNCPERLMTAQNSILFTTFDEILNKYLNNGAENQLRKFVGDFYLMLLLDFLVYPLGPRIRDHISHGEVILADVPVSAAQHLIWLCYLLALHLLPEDSPLPKNKVFECVQQKMNEYKSIFHPLSIVKQKVSSLAHGLSRWSAIPRPDVALVKSDGSHQALDQQNFVVTGLSQLNISRSGPELPHASCSALKAAMAFERFLHSDKHGCQAEDEMTNLQWILVPFSDCGNLVERKLSELIQNTVYRYESPFAQVGDENGSQGEEEILGILSKVLSTLLKASAQIYDVLFARHDQWQKKELRSRQRNTYARMLDGLDLISDVLRLILFIALVSVCKLDDLEPRKSVILIRFLKKVQKYSENLSVQTNISCNKWDEAVVQSLELIAMMASLENK